MPTKDENYELEKIFEINRVGDKLMIINETLDHLQIAIYTVAVAICFLGIVIIFK